MLPLASDEDIPFVKSLSRIDQRRAATPARGRGMRSVVVVDTWRASRAKPRRSRHRICLPILELSANFLSEVYAQRDNVARRLEARAKKASSIRTEIHVFDDGMVKDTTSMELSVTHARKVAEDKQSSRSDIEGSLSSRV